MSSSSPISFVLSTPLYLWDLYVEYLWNYKPGTWVYRIASTSWILAFLVLAPFVILTLLDVASYVIARTLGVVESTKASTGEMPVEVQHKPRDGGNGSINGTSPTTINSDTDVPSIHVVDPTPPMSASNGLGEDDATSYLENSVVSEGNLQLAGIDAFSPAPSQPPSPTISRTSLNGSRFTLRPLTELSGKTGRESSDDSENSGERSSEEASGVQMRRRVRNERDDRDR